MSRNLSTFMHGVRNTSPLIVGVAPFGFIFGAVCVNAGMPEWSAIGMSIIIFAGASQLVATQLMADHASIAVVILTGLVINMRMFMYSASIAPHFKGLHPVRKGMLAYMLTDQAYAISIARYCDSDSDSINKPLFYFGSALTMWTCFNVTTALGAYLGAFIPAEWSLDFAIPLTFIALVIPVIKDKPAAMAALVGGLVAFLAATMPFNLGLMAGAVSGIAAGYVLEMRMKRGQSNG